MFNNLRIKHNNVHDPSQVHLSLPHQTTVIFTVLHLWKAILQKGFEFHWDDDLLDDQQLFSSNADTDELLRQSAALLFYWRNSSDVMRIYILGK